MKQTEKIILYLKRHNYITALEAVECLGILQFHTRMSELKNEGYIFGSESCFNKKTKARFNKYNLLK